MSNTVLATVPHAPDSSQLPGLDSPRFGVYVVGMVYPYGVVSAQPSAGAGVVLVYTSTRDGAMFVHVSSSAGVVVAYTAVSAGAVLVHDSAGSLIGGRPQTSADSKVNMAYMPDTGTSGEMRGGAAVTVDALEIATARARDVSAVAATVAVLEIAAVRFCDTRAAAVTVDVLAIEAPRRCVDIAAAATVDALAMAAALGAIGT